MTGYIPDGYTESGYIAGVPRLFLAVRFEFRPMLVEEKQQAAKDGEGGNVRKTMAEWLARKITRWDLQDADGQTLPIDAKTILRLRPKLFDRLFDVVAGNEASDLDPDTGEQAKPF